MNKSESFIKSKYEGIEFLSEPADYSMADDWYEIAKADHFWMQWRFKVLEKMIPCNYEWGRTLEIGCGHGVVRQQIENRFNCSVEGCDLNLDSLGMAVSGRGKLYFYNIHQRRNELKEQFSTILLLDVIEHIDEPIPFLESVSFHLKPGGKLIIGAPALPLLYSQYDVAAGHSRRYTFSLLKQQVESCGFKLEEKSYWGFCLIPVLFLRKIVLPFYRKKIVIKAGFQPPAVWIEDFFQFLRKLECRFMSKVPLGISLLAIVQKQK